MAEPSASDVTGLLHAWTGGNRDALDRLLPILYDELLRIARKHMLHERYNHTLQPTALVNEAYLRLVDLQQMEWRDRAHFFAVSSETVQRDWKISKAWLARKIGGLSNRPER